MRLGVAGLALISSVAAFASPQDSLIRTKSALELELAIVEAAESSRLNEKCRVELAGVDIPRSCFILIRRRDESTPEWLTRVCEKRARGAARLRSLRDLDDLPAGCRAVAIERRLDLEYRLEDESPERLFEDARASEKRSGN